jgi:hypothetical protein
MDMEVSADEACNTVVVQNANILCPESHSAVPATDSTQSALLAAGDVQTSNLKR